MISKIKHLWVPFAAMLLFTLGLYLFTTHTITVNIDGQSRPMTVHALTVGGALGQAGHVPASSDRVSPSTRSFLVDGMTIEVQSARPVVIYLEPQGQTMSIQSAGRTPLELLKDAGIKPSPQDRYWLNGLPVNGDDQLPPVLTYLLQVRQPQPLVVSNNGTNQTLYSSATTLAGVLWDKQVSISRADQLSLPAGSLFTRPQGLIISPGQSITIQVGGSEINVHSNAKTVGQAVADAGISLQGLDATIPEENQPIPSDGKIKVVRIQEQIITQQTDIPFSKKVQGDPNTELDQSSIIQIGEPGLKVDQVRVRRRKWRNSASTRVTPSRFRKSIVR
jgi:uncharacterized protein YabE (DUF348 family)